MDLAQGTTMIKQLEGLINSEYEDVGAMQKALLEAIPAIETAVNKNTTDRKELGKKADELASLKKALGEKLGIEDVDVTSINEAIETMSKSSNKDIESLKADLSAKYNADLDTLRAELSNKDAIINESNTKLNDTLFKTSIIDGGLLDGFVDEPMARNNIISQIKENLLYEDGVMYVKDNATGDKAKDIRTGEFLKPLSVVEGLKKTINPMYLARETQANGGNTPPPSNQSTPSVVDPSKHRDTKTFMADAFSSIQQ